ncbi:DPH3 homolog [Oryx dammah]|uniref:DPH3 homolog n=1 Tax=Oryx dammah TaxID=59534 RepID=UPI001A9BBFEE|nr:DPH3 homolog [Oryx dammah]
MAMFHDKVEIEDFQYDKDSRTCFYSCPCGGNFCIVKEGLKNREDMAAWPSCSLLVNVIYAKDQFTPGETVPAPSADRELVKR